MAITIKDEEVLRALDSLDKLRHLRQQVQRAGAYLMGKVRRYPPGDQHRPQPFVSDRQRRGFFARLHAGEIEVEYKRGRSPGSENLQQKWNVKISNGGFRATVGNNTSYGPLVQGPKKQTQYHKETGWRTTEDVLDAEEAAVLEMLNDGLTKDVQG